MEEILDEYGMPRGMSLTDPHMELEIYSDMYKFMDKITTDIKFLKETEDRERREELEKEEEERLEKERQDKLEEEKNGSSRNKSKKPTKNNTKNNTPKKVRSNVKAGTQFLAGSSSNFRKFTTLNVSVDTTMTPLVKKRTLDINNSSNNNYSNHINSPSLFVKRNENPYLNNDYLQFENNVFKFDKNEFVEMKKKTSFNCSSSRKNSFTTKNTFSKLCFNI